MKKKAKHILLGLMSTIIVGGAIGVVGYASDGFQNWETGTWFKDEFKDVKIESKVIAYDGEKKQLDIVIPSGATSSIIITNNKGVTVTECQEKGIYNYKVTVTIGEKSKVFNATLEIKDQSEIKQVQLFNPNLSY